MRRKWSIIYQPVHGMRQYQVYRLLDSEKPACSDNREYVTGFATQNRAQALHLAYRLNMATQ